MNKTIISLLISTTIMAGEAPTPPNQKVDIQPVTVAADHPSEKGITKEQWMKKAAERFEKADADHDGVVTREEMKAFIGGERKEKHGDKKEFGKEEK